VCVSLCSLHMLFFTDWVPSQQKQYTMGWSMIVIMCLNMLVNLFFVLQAGINQIRLLYLHYSRRLLSKIRETTSPKKLPLIEIEYPDSSRSPSSSDEYKYLGVMPVLPPEVKRHNKANEENPDSQRTEDVKELESQNTEKIHQMSSLKSGTVKSQFEASILGKSRPALVLNDPFDLIDEPPPLIQKSEVQPLKKIFKTQVKKQNRKKKKPLEL